MFGDTDRIISATTVIEAFDLLKELGFEIKG